MTRYRVVAPYVTLRSMTQDGVKVLGYHQGAVVPDDVPDSEVQAHLESNLIAAEEDAVLDAQPGEPTGPTGRASLPMDRLDERAPDFLRSGGTTADREVAEQAKREARKARPAGSDGDDGPPPQSEPKAAWVDYAVTKRAAGQSEDDARAKAEALSKEQLVGRYGAKQR